MYGSSRQGARSWLGDVFGFDPVAAGRSDAYGIEIERTDNGLRIEVPVAGFKPEEINVTVEDRQLTIEGRAERRRFTRSLVLPEEIDAEAIEAHVEHGMLTLTLPVHARMKPRRVEVRVGGQEMKSVGASSQGDGGQNAGAQGGQNAGAQGAGTQANGTQTTPA